MITWLASYPRSGNTFLRIILNKVFDIQTYSVYNDLNDIEAHGETKEIVGHRLLPQGFNIDEASKSSEEYFLKTHRQPPAETDKVIYLVRDGRDCITSYFHYRNEYNNAPPIRDFIEGKIKVGSWSDHIEKWTNIKNEKLLIIKFEELIAADMNVISKIEVFIKREAVITSLPSFQELNRMNPKFFRSGRSTSYKELFTEQDHLAFWKLHSAQMLRFNYTDNIPENLRIFPN